MQLRPYQLDGASRTVAALRNRPILVMPTGSGKTLTAVEVIQRCGCPTLWLAHRQELIEQAAHHLGVCGLYAGIIKSGVRAEPEAPIQVASVATLAKRKRLHPAELIVIDECHHASAGTYQAVLDRYPQVPVVGLTATPFRLDGRGLGEIFGEIIVPTTVRQLCDNGVLFAPKVWAGKSPDLTGVEVIAGDYHKRQTGDRCNTATITGDIVDTWKRRAAGKRTVCFAVNREHSKAITTAFTAAEIPAEHIDGTMDRNRSAILRRLASGETQVVCNCMILTEGWDLPALECAILARPTASLNLHLQMIGRIMRAGTGKTGCICLDHAGNHHVHGLVTRVLEYSLDDRKVGESEPLGLRRCRQCGLFFDPESFACPECGWHPTASDRSAATPGVAGEGELEEFIDDFDYKASVWRELEAQRVAAGYSDGWSVYRFEERFGCKPVIAAGGIADGRDTSRENKIRVYSALVDQGKARQFKPGWAANKYREVFGVWPRGLGVDDGRGDDIRHRYMAMAGGEKP